MTDKEKLEIKKVQATVDLYERIAQYRKRSYDNKLIDTIFMKKNKLIDEATTCSQVDAIMKGPIPFDDSGVTIPEEEMLMWSEASLKAPLNSEATNRYLSLAKSFFGEKVFEECGIA